MKSSSDPMTVLPRSFRKRAAPRRLGKLLDRQLLERFLRTGDEAAFTTLVARHGPLVLRVCRNVLHEEHAAEDAFQAAFLVLIRKAGTIRRQQSLSSWLYKVAYRIALEARTAAVQRQAREAQVPGKTAADPLAEITGRELLAVLDEELMRLPEKYRAPLVLCYLESATTDEAARQLDWSLSTFKRRLDAGRELLRTRLARRGLTLAAAFATILMASGTVAAALPARLLSSTLQAVAAETVSARLATGGWRASFLAKLALLGAVGLGTMGGIFSLSGYPHKPAAPPVLEIPRPAAQEEKKPAGKPLRVVPHAVESTPPVNGNSNVYGTPAEPPDMVELRCFPSTYWCTQERTLPFHS